MSKIAVAASHRSLSLSISLRLHMALPEFNRIFSKASNVVETLLKVPQSRMHLPMERRACT